MHRLRFTIGLLVALSLWLAPGPLFAQAQSIRTYVNFDDYFKEVVLASVRQPVLVCFYSKDFKHGTVGQIASDNMMVVCQDLARDLNGKVKVLEYNVPASDVAEVYAKIGMWRIPSAALYKDGKMIDMMSGDPVTQDDIELTYKAMKGWWIKSLVLHPEEYPCSWKYRNSGELEQACK